MPIMITVIFRVMRSPSVVIMMNSRNNNESGSSSRSSRESADAEAAGSHQQVGDGGLPDISDVDIGKL
jgi:hypothetical protein